MKWQKSESEGRKMISNQRGIMMAILIGTVYGFIYKTLEKILDENSIILLFGWLVAFFLFPILIGLKIKEIKKAFIFTDAFLTMFILSVSNIFLTIYSPFSKFCLDLILMFGIAIPSMAFLIGGLAGAAFGDYVINREFPFFHQISIQFQNKKRINQSIYKDVQIHNSGIFQDYNSSNFKYDVSISFAGEDRKIVEKISKELIKKGVKVFYDQNHKYKLWGKKLSTYFQDIYGPESKFVIILISKYYPIRDWTDFEFSIVKKEAKNRKTEYILPVRLDNTKILGIHEDIAYLDYKNEGIQGIVEGILEKLSNK
jgi:hypothetical protein